MTSQYGYSPATGTAVNANTGSGILDLILRYLSQNDQNQNAANGLAGYYDPSTLGAVSALSPTLARDTLDYQQRLGEKSTLLDALGLLTSKQGPANYLKYNYALGNLNAPQGTDANLSNFVSGLVSPSARVGGQAPIDVAALLRARGLDSNGNPLITTAPASATPASTVPLMPNAAPASNGTLAPDALARLIAGDTSTLANSPYAPAANQPTYNATGSSNEAAILADRQRILNQQQAPVPTVTAPAASGGYQGYNSSPVNSSGYTTGGAQAYAGGGMLESGKMTMPLMPDRYYEPMASGGSMASHPGFQGAAEQVSRREGIPLVNAERIIGANKAHASKAARKANPRLTKTAKRAQGGKVVDEAVVGDLNPGQGVAGTEELVKMLPPKNGRSRAEVEPFSRRKDPFEAAMMMRRMGMGGMLGYADGGLLGGTIYGGQDVANSPTIQTLLGNTRGNYAGQTGFNTTIPGSGTQLGDRFNISRYADLLPTEQSFTQGIYETPTDQGGLGLDFNDILQRSLRAAPRGQQSQATYYGS